MPFKSLAFLRLKIFILLYALFSLGFSSCSPIQPKGQQSARKVANLSNYGGKYGNNYGKLDLEDKFHLIFDIDWTLVVPLSEKQAQLVKGHPNLIKVFEESYLLKQGAKEVLQNAFKNQDLVVSFFSGGHQERNDELLKQIRFSDGSSAFDHAYKVLSRSDLTVLSEDTNLRFSQRYKKDISKISPNIQRALLVEDIEHFALAPGEGQTLWLGRTYFPKLPGMSWQESNEAWKSTGVEERFLAPNEGASWWNQRKLFYLEGLISAHDSPEEIIAMAQKFEFSEDRAPRNWQKVFGPRPPYQNFMRSMPCESIIPL